MGPVAVFTVAIKAGVSVDVAVVPSSPASPAGTPGRLSAMVGRSVIFDAQVPAIMSNLRESVGGDKFGASVLCPVSRASEWGQ